MSLSNRIWQASYYSTKSFSGDLSESIDLVIPDYRHCSTIYSFDETAMAAISPVLYPTLPKTVFLDNVSLGMTFDEIESFMTAEFNMQVQQKIESLRIDVSMSESCIAIQ